MAHFAKINIKNNTVEQVIVVDNNSIQNLEFPQSEIEGQKFIKSIGLKGTWMQTSYNSKFRKNYAGVGFTYDSVRNAFIPPKPYESWSLNEDTCLWEPPMPRPSNSDLYVWDEKNKKWVK